ncbi:MAG TPA: hypothetical protein PKB11_06445 [Desulfovibrio sp.]|jgi:hypothetical protein|uniref:hypothetical protein n=1 Tax=Desulfovibrio TaxID=872 RepID=UPI002A4DB8F6|nr:hypothetical protein [Desulfovibrio sp.]MDY0305947.1 hypothetical protein [Desulfovibrionaceae bacterium]HMM38381.1 hypothetical protein [Desulfovibrio sp.]
MFDPKECILYSGGAGGAEAEFGAQAERYGLQEVHFSFEGHQPARARGLRVLTSEELALKDVSLGYVSKLMNRTFSSAPKFRAVLQSICWQVSSGHEVFVVGSILPDGTVKGGTGWGAEYSKICNKPLYVFDQERKNWFQWVETEWRAAVDPIIGHHHFTGTGTRFLTDEGREAIAGLFARSFSR